MGTEIAVKPEHLDRRSTWTPYSPLEALMSVAPGEDPEESHLEMLERREKLLKLLDGAWDQLDPIEREIVDAIVFEHLSLRQVADRFQGRIGKTWVAHLRDQAFDKMRAYLEGKLEDGTAVSLDGPSEEAADRDRASKPARDA